MPLTMVEEVRSAEQVRKQTPQGWWQSVGWKGKNKAEKQQDRLMD